MLEQFMLLIPLCYAIFVFTSGTFNPFRPMSAPLKRRSWRLGRAIAMASLVAGLITVFAFNVYGLDSRMALSIYLVLVSLFVIPSVIKYRKTSVWR